MAIDNPISDTSRSIQHDPDYAWPHAVKLAMHWMDRKGRVYVRTETITADQFFGHGSSGAPLEGQALIAMIERMRREGPPIIKRKGKR